MKTLYQFYLLIETVITMFIIHIIIFVIYNELFLGQIIDKFYR